MRRPIVIDQPIALLLGPDETVDESPLLLARSMLDATRAYWQEWVRGLSIPADWQDAVIRAAITLKLCTYEDTGAVVAALTTSIPEHAGSGRNWDYRYCWLRDAYFVVQALNRLGATQTMEGFLHFIDHIVARGDGAGVQPLYGLSGDAQLPERIETALDGLPRDGARACRQPGLRAAAARRVRLGDPRLHAALLRSPADESAATSRSSSASSISEIMPSAPLASPTPARGSSAVANRCTPSRA